jgi:hypothetical protein
MYSKIAKKHQGEMSDVIVLIESSRLVGSCFRL